jgi:uncharacterized integral membrane protein
MGKLFFILIFLFLLRQIFFQKGYKKLIWFYFGILFVPSSVTIISNISFPRLLILVFFLIFIIQNTTIKKHFFKFPLWFPLTVVFFCLLSIGLFDERIRNIVKISRPIYYFFENFSAVFLTFFYLRSISDLKRIYNFIILCFLLFGLYGIINYYTKVSLYNSFIADTYKSIDFGNRYSILGDARFRIASFAWHPIYYGLILSFAILILVFTYSQKKLRTFSSFFYLSILVLLCFNLFLTNSRTPLMSLIIGLSFFYFFAIKFGNKVKIALISVIAIFTIVTISPKSFKLIDESIKTFTSQGSKLEGSSLEMREAQMGASVLIFMRNPVFGNGFNYITEDLGFSSDENKRDSDNELQGFESYSYKLLIEQGCIGIFANLFFFIYLFIYLFKTRKNVDELGKKIIYLTMSMTITFLLFIIGTGDMGGFMIFMALLGINLKAIILSQKSRNPVRNINNQSKSLKTYTFE